jgi:hypothetical protein
MTTSLPAEVLNLVEMSPVEDVILTLLREKLPDIPIQTRVQPGQTFPFVMIRNDGSWGDWTGDPRFLDASILAVHCFCQGLNADEDASLLSEAVRVILRDSKNYAVPGRGHIVSTHMTDRPKRTPDWATSTGPVQYADLPTDVERWEGNYRVVIRKPTAKPFA